MPGASAKPWRAFLSAATDGPGTVHAIDRIGDGPWYDRLGRTFALRKADLPFFRPTSADTAIKFDFPNEDGVPNHAPDGTIVDNHDTLTGSNALGQVYSGGLYPNEKATCLDWTSKQGDRAVDGRPRVGHSWPRTAGPGMDGGVNGVYGHWISSLTESGCAPGVNLIEQGGPKENETTVGSGGGYGGWYCFSLVP
jgi:hypothetical protein